MTKDNAARLVAKLEALASDSAATPSEATSARAKAKALRAKYHLDAKQVRSERRRTYRRQQPRPRTTYAAPRAAPRRAAAPLFNAFDQFDPKTGKATGGIKVHHYQDPRNWKIELPT